MNKQSYRMQNYKARLRKYGLTENDHMRMIDRQDNNCYICGRDGATEKNGLCIDHCHETGVVRKLLCNRCNFVVGIVESDFERLALALQYVEDFQSDRLSRE